MLEKLRKNWVPLFIGVVIVLLIAAAVLRALAPPIVSVPQSPQFTQSNFYNTTTTFQNIAFSGSAISVPTQMTVAKMTTTGNTDSVITQLTQDFQLTPLPNVPGIWQGPNYSLSKSDNLNYYTVNLNDILPATSHPNKDQSIAAAQSILQKYAPNSQVSVVDNQIAYYTASPEPVITTADKADWIYLPFSYQIDGLPLFYQNQREYPFEILLDAQNNLVKFSFYTFYVQLTPLSKQNTISVEQAIKNINAGHASLIGTNTDDPAGSNISQIKSAQLNKVTLEYRADDTTSLVYPFYRFSGDAVNVNNVPITVEIITPAIPTVAQN